MHLILNNQEVGYKRCNNLIFSEERKLRLERNWRLNSAGEYKAKIPGDRKNA